MGKSGFSIQFAPEVLQHLQAVPRQHHGLLRWGPNNRFRVFYAGDESARLVNILAIGVKEGNRLLVGREEYRP